MAFLKVEDSKGSVEVVVFPFLYLEVLKLLKLDNVVMIRGKIQKKSKKIKVLGTAISGVKVVNENFTIEIIILIDPAIIIQKSIMNIKQILKKYPGRFKIFLYIYFLNEADII